MWSGESIPIDICCCCCVMFHMLLTWLRWWQQTLQQQHHQKRQLQRINQSTYINASFRMILTVDECCTHFGRISRFLPPSVNMSVSIRLLFLWFIYYVWIWIHVVWIQWRCVSVCYLFMCRRVCVCTNTFSRVWQQHHGVHWLCSVYQSDLIQSVSVCLPLSFYQNLSLKCI